MKLPYVVIQTINAGLHLAPYEGHKNLLGPATFSCDPDALVSVTAGTQKPEWRFALGESHDLIALKYGIQDESLLFTTWNKGDSTTSIRGN
jgi:hypothetical protein